LNSGSVLLNSYRPFNHVFSEYILTTFGTMLHLLIRVLIALVSTWQARASAAGKETLVAIVGPDYVMLGADSSISQSIALKASNLDKIAVLVDPFPSGRPDRGTAASPFSQQTIVAAAAGDAADTDRLLLFLAGQSAVREFEASVGCDVEFVSCGDTNSLVAPFAQAGISVSGVARLARQQIASKLRSATPISVCLLVAGMEPVTNEYARSETHFAAKQVQMQVDASSSTLLHPILPASESHRIAKLEHGLVPRLFWLDEYGSIQQLQYGAHGFGSNFILSILDQGYRSDLNREEAFALLTECFAQLRTRFTFNSPQPPCIKCVDAKGCRLIQGK
jgi:20S proteasome alpha/beta subunit